MAKDVFVTMRIKSEVKDKLKLEAENQERTLSSLISLILKSYVIEQNNSESFSKTHR